ncbi:pilus assembly PilX N-terminal domain-containing protein [Candidatus Uabimicrobium amorphum]|uniref:Uncharacterized protein n=1 Tax=Uabimicrobium amorphum TaxID=2596890 RepID=A0A5S9IV87_UABAM|nr:pilus assembly PilX N-terminal domain-containing protein [Candidatus Uabimicrobium amorphum]BBM88131.1 hypothetical protein UABAM_06547 [Candidatus Uabimicrobium amorphum]
MKKLKNKERKGITLIIVTSIMLVLSTTAVTFVRLTGYERTAASNYASTVDAKLTAYAGVDHALALIYDNIRRTGRIGLSEPPVNGVTLQYPANSDRDVFLASQTPEPISLELDIDLYNDGDNNDPFTVSGLVGRTIGGDIFGTSELHGNFYSLKLEDSSGKLNVNSFIPVNVNANGNVTLRTDAATVVPSAETMRRLLLTLAELAFPASDANFHNALASAVLNTPLNPNTRTRFTSMQEVETKINTDVAGFEGSAGAERFLSNLTTSSIIDTSTVAVSVEDALDLRDAPEYYHEARAPVNINTASRDVLIALIVNIRGRANFFASQIQDDDDPTFSNNAIRVETTLRNDIAQFEIAIPQAEAEALADEIIRRREVDGNPFLDQGEIDEFFNAQNINIPVPNLGDPTNGAINAATVVKNTGLNPGSPVVSQQVWNQAVRDMLRSNFNPNTVENFWNPNAGAFRRVSTSDLVRIESDGTNLQTNPSHTLELVPSSVGSVEITSVGRTTAQQGNLVTGISIIETVAEFGREVTHTTQSDFEPDTGLATTVTSPNNIAHQRAVGAPVDEDLFAGAVEPNPILDINGDNPGNGNRTGGGNSFSSGNNFVAAGNNEQQNRFNTNGTYKSPAQWTTQTVNPGGAKTIKYNVRAANNSLIKSFEGLPFIMEAKNTVRQPGNNITYDGLVSRRMYYTPDFVREVSPSDAAIGLRQNDSLERYLIETCFEDFTTSSGGDNVSSYLANRSVGNSQPDLRSGNTSGESKMGNRNGSVQFWVKFDADNTDDINGNSIACGLFGATTASGFRQGRVANDSQGNDLFGRTDIFFREGTQTYLYINALGELRATRLYYALCFPLTGQTPYGAFFDTEVDFANRKVPRRDVIMRTTPFKAHEWYHLRLVWDDTLNGNASIDLFVNDEKVTPNIATIEEVDELAFNNEYCLLNEREPLDGMFINGFPRAQAKKGGYFHFNEDGDHIHMPGNATIDQFISSESKNFATTSGDSRRRFPETTTYTNSFNLNDDDAVIAAIRWTSYPPYRQDADDDSDFPSVRLSSVTVNGTSQGVNQNNTTTEDSQQRELVVAGDIIGNTNINSQQVDYTFEFTSPRPKQPVNNTNELQGARCATLDSVTLLMLKRYPVLRDTEIQ